MRAAILAIVLVAGPVNSDEPGNVVLNAAQRAFCDSEGGCRLLTNMALRAMLEAAMVAGQQRARVACWRDA